MAAASVCVYYKAHAFDWNSAVLVTITDASWAGERMVVEDKEFPRRSQMGRLTLLADTVIWEDFQDHPNSCNLHLIGHKSRLITRTCRSTMCAEAQAMSNRVGEGFKVRTGIAEMRGMRDDARRAESCANFMKHVWLTDCESLNSYLNNPVAAPVEDKRLEIDLQELRQLLWEDHYGNPKDS